MHRAEDEKVAASGLYTILSEINEAMLHSLIETRRKASEYNKQVNYGVTKTSNTFIKRFKH